VRNPVSFLVCSALLATAVAANAATLVTPAIIADDASEYVRCLVTNAGSKDIEVRVEVLDAGGAVVGTGGPLTLEPGHTFGNALGLGSLHVCRFTVPSKNKVRAGACLSPNGSLSCQTHVDAR
jgi:hypothetical protein